jgi:hypothetical protein
MCLGIKNIESEDPVSLSQQPVLLKPLFFSKDMAHMVWGPPLLSAFALFFPKNVTVTKKTIYK